MSKARDSWPAHIYHDTMAKFATSGRKCPSDRPTRESFTKLIVDEEQVLGSTNLYEDGRLRYVPMPSPDPKDPLNLPDWRKWTAIIVLCFFGALGLAVEVVIGMILPVFLLEYSGVDPKSVLSRTDLASKGPSPLALVPPDVKPVDLMQVSLLATVPQIANGISSYFLIPLSIAIGRRPVLLMTAVAACAGGFWAGSSTSLNSHIAARVVHGLGAGAVEALLPLIVQDMVFIHQRAKATSAVVASQGVFIVIFGVLAPYLSVHYTWRYLYWITSTLGVVAGLLVFAWVPETRWIRSKEELNGQKLHPIADGQARPTLDPATYGARTMRTNLGLFPFGFEWKQAGWSVVNALRTTIFPAVIYTVIANCASFMVSLSTNQITSFALLSAGVPFEYTGVAVIPSILATIFTYIFGGVLADRVAIFITKRNGGLREPEYHLVNFTFPFFSSIVGCFIFGVAAQNNLHVVVLLLGSFLILLGTLALLTTSSVFLVESYPQWAGPVLVNVSSLRIIITFFASSNATTWLQIMGPLKLFAVFGETLIIVALGLPLLYFTGKRLRGWTGGKVKSRDLPGETTTLREKPSESSMK